MSHSKVVSAIRLVRDDIWTTRHLYLDRADDALPALTFNDTLAIEKDYRNLAGWVDDFEDWAAIVSARRVIYARTEEFTEDQRIKALAIPDQARVVLIELTEMFTD